MTKIKLLLVSILCIGSLFFSGCVNQGTTSEQTFEGISIESDVVELAFANTSITKEEMYTDEGDSYFQIKAFEVQYLFHNLLDRRVNISFFVEFYNKDNVKLYSVGPRYMNLIADYTEKAVLDINKATFTGERTAGVDHVKIIAFES
jgi:hypothetical protein